MAKPGRLFTHRRHLTASSSATSYGKGLPFTQSVGLGGLQ